MSRIISIASQKGGVGKTTTAINLSSALAHFSYRVLLIDLDPSGNASKGLGIDTSLLNNTIFDVLAGKIDIKSVVVKPANDDIDLLPSKLILSSLDSFININNKDKEYLLKNKLEEIKNDYDYIIIDCPPNLGLLTINALTASDSILIPIQCEYFALDATTPMLAAVSQIQSTTNKNIEIEGFLLTMYDAKTNLDIEICRSVRGLFKENTFSTIIPRNISIPESSYRGSSVIKYRHSSIGAQAYISLAKEIIDKN